MLVEQASYVAAARRSFAATAHRGSLRLMREVHRFPEVDLERLAFTWRIADDFVVRVVGPSHDERYVRLSDLPFSAAGTFAALLAARQLHVGFSSGDRQLDLWWAERPRWHHRPFAAARLLFLLVGAHGAVIGDTIGVDVQAALSDGSTASIVVDGETALPLHPAVSATLPRPLPRPAHARPRLLALYGVSTAAPALRRS